jgi:hypothetical protein
MSANEWSEQELQEYVGALLPLWFCLRRWRAQLDRHPDGCDCTLCEWCMHMLWLNDTHLALAESDAPAGTCARLARAKHEMFGDEAAAEEAEGAEEEGPAAAVQLPRGGYF